MSDDGAPRADQLDGAPHPRETVQLYGHDTAEAEFLAAHGSGRLHSGWLITGPRGVGKATLAYRMAQFLLEGREAGGGLFGDAPTRIPLDPESRDAHLIRSGAHPGLEVLTRGMNKTGSALSDSISVDRVRELKEFFHLSASDGGHRVVIVDAADELNKSAANAILKELEEPPARTTLLLLAHQPSRLLPTIRSRCRTLRLNPLSGPDLTRALAQAGFEIEAGESLAALSGGSVGDAIRLLHADGLALYGQIAGLFGRGGHIDRDAAVKLADSVAGRAADARFRLLSDLIDIFATRAARAGLIGPPQVQAAPHEAELLAQLSPHDVAARDWADLSADLGERLRHGRAVNVDSAALTLEALLRMEHIARRHAA